MGVLELAIYSVGILGCYGLLNIILNLKDTATVQLRVVRIVFQNTILTREGVLTFRGELNMSRTC